MKPKRRFPRLFERMLASALSKIHGLQVGDCEVKTVPPWISGAQNVAGAFDPLIVRHFIRLQLRMVLNRKHRRIESFIDKTFRVSTSRKRVHDAIRAYSRRRQKGFFW